MTRAAIGLGSNLGDRTENLRKGISATQSFATVVKTSKVYETAPMYVEDQPSFLNAAILIETELGPLPLLTKLKQIEQELGRSGAERYGPREIDLDLLTYGVAQYVYRMEGKEVLVLPHPRIPERRFVLQPLLDLDPNFRIEGLGKVETLLASTEVQAQSVLETTDARLPVLRS